MMKTGGFNLRKWFSNSSELRQCMEAHESKSKPEYNSLPKKGTMEEDTTYAKSAPGSESPQSKTVEQKISGLNWNFQMDTLVFKFDDIIKLAIDLPTTKGCVLKIITKVFDPLGVLSPVFIRMKFLFQELCQDKTDWDDSLPESLCQR